MDKAKILQVIEEGGQAVKAAAALRTELDQHRDAAIKQAAAVEAVLPAALDALIGAGIIGEQQKAAAVASLTDPVACIQTLTNVLQAQIKSAAAHLGGPAGPPAVKAASQLESDRVWSEGIRNLRR